MSMTGRSTKSPQPDTNRTIGMSQYKLVTYQSPQGARAGLLVDETIFDVAAATERASYATMLDVLRDWDAARGRLRDAAATAAGKRGHSRARRC